jgi:hypothetical protein
MSIFSWFFGSRRRNLVRTRYDTPELDDVQTAAAEDIAAVESDDKYFDPDGPGQQPGF